VKTKFKSLLTGFIAFSLFTIGPIGASARQVGSQEPVPPPPPPAYATTPSPSPNGPPPPPPSRRGLRPGPPAPAACGPEAPPPSPAAAVVPPTPAVTVRNTIRQFNYGPEGEISGFVLSNGTQVNVPPEAGGQLGSLGKSKSEITVSGYARQSVSGRSILDATSITANGQTVSVLAQLAEPRSALPPPPPPPADGPQSGPPQN
jgi:hypothetical protein